MARDSLILRFALLMAVSAALASCARQQPPPAPPPVVPEAPAPPATAIEAGVKSGPTLADLDPAEAEQAYRAFLISCPSVTSRDDVSGLTRKEDWIALCGATPRDVVHFMRTAFETVEVGDGTAFATGYYEPEIRGCRTRQPGCEVPIYAPPPDLLETNPLTGERGRGRLDANGAFILYHDRAEIESGVLAGRGLEIAWAADPVDLFFLQIQGSGRVRMADGSVMRIGYASQNGREYVAIGRLLRDRGILESPITMQAITAWLRAHPEEGEALMQENKSYIFFRELTGPGPLGALGRPVTPLVTVAADPKFVPLGAPVLLRGMDMPAANGLWVAQDTGGAIRGSNRFDTFWGAGDQAAAIAGGMSARGRAYLLLPRGTLDRIRANGSTAQR
ncbi:MAG TPA: murein transglycosylase A [Allosphingosinicella sp.]|nr:murein transglycosylase A [Allosphingosinicella sp.]